MKVEEDPYVQNLFQSRNLKPATINWYTKILKQYCLFLNKTPTELINEAIDEEEQGIRKINRKLRTYQIQYRNHLLQKGQSPLSIKNIIAIIRSFYNEYEIDLPKLKLNLPKEEKLITKEDLIQKEHIQTALKHANNKYRAIILLMLSSGMGSSEVRYLTVEDFLKAIELPLIDTITVNEIISQTDKKNIPCATWRIRRIKTDMPYFTFSSPESIHAILTYLQEREHKSGQITKDSHLFTVDGHQTAAKSFVEYFAKLNDICCFGFFGRQRFFRAHVLRKYFATTLQEHRVQPLVTEWLLGHKVNPVTGAYIKPDITALRHDYLRVLSYLSIDEVKVHTIDSPEVKEIKSELASVKEENMEFKRFMNDLLEHPELMEVAKRIKK